MGSFFASKTRFLIERLEVCGMYIFVDVILIARILEVLMALVLFVCGMNALSKAQEENEEMEAEKDKARKEAYNKVINNRES